MCGIVGIIGNNPVATELYDGLIALQHRGQDSAGIATYNKRFHIRKGMGLVRDVFQQEHMNYLEGNLGIGQVRYPTVGGYGIEDAQPFIVKSPYGIAMAHNGNIYNFEELKKELFEKDWRYVNSNNDVEVILNVFAHELSRFCHRDFFESVCLAAKSVYTRVRGAYSVVGMIATKGMVVFRDPHGIRPLVWGKRMNNGREEHIFASENTMFEFLGYEYYRDVENGEVIFIDMEGNVKTRIVDQKEFRPCIFEYIYFARQDAFLNGVSVQRARLRMGQNLARKIQRDYSHLQIDRVIPAPSTANTAALACAHELGVRYTEGLVKNAFVGRTFIMPGQELRQKANQYKLSPIDIEIRDKNVLVVDDSIVRGNVSKHIVDIIRRHGANKVYFASTAPPIIWPDIYGIDMPTRDELIAHNRTIEEIRDYIGADELIYQDLDDVVEAVMRKKDKIKFKRLHTAYFNGDYPTEDITTEVIEKMEAERKQQRFEANLN